MGKNYISIFTKKDFNGFQETKEFLDEVFIEMVDSIKKYYNHQPASSKEYGFEFGEQQVKTFISIALNKITNGNFIQEYPLGRKFHNNDDGDIFSANGYLDYWASRSPCDYLIEVKHGWIRYYPDSNHYTLYKRTLDKFKSSIRQLDAVECKTDYRLNNHLLGIGLTVAPLFVHNRDLKVLKLNKELNDSLFYDIQQANGDFMAIWYLEKKFTQQFKFESDGREIVEYFPAVCFFGKIKKYSRK